MNIIKKFYKIKIWKTKSSGDYTFKQKIVKEFGDLFDIETLIETGTFRGEMVFSQLQNFKRIISIELDKMLYKNAKRKFKRNYKVSIFNGDSGELLPKILNEIKEPCLFWLDGHYSGGITSKGKLNTPIIKELESIADNNQNHVILIDDARCFNGEEDYPSINSLERFVSDNLKRHKLEVKDDIIRITPNGK